MKVTLYILIYIILSLDIWAIDIDEKTSNINVLSKSYVFLDEKNHLSLEEVLEENFHENKEETLGYGFMPDKDLWIRFKLKNTSNRPIEKVLEYASSITENVYFYNKNETNIDGMWSMAENRTSLNPSFNIFLEPLETQTYYIKANSKISSLIATLTLWNNDDYIEYDYEKKIYLFVFFAIMMTLFIYNFMLYIFTKDKAYLYYILYLFSVIFFQLNYLGIIPLYLYTNPISAIVGKASMVYIGFMIVTIILFTREFLGTQRFKTLDKLLVIYLYITPIVAILSYDNFLFNLSIITIFIPAATIVIYTGFYALYKGVRQAKFYVLGWSFVLISLLFINFKTIGLFDITRYYPYISEISFIIEALLFSIALAHRINITTQEKIQTDKKLIQLQQDEQYRLEKLVKEKTKDLSDALNEKEILYTELNHRVKNNIQMVLSLIKLQIQQTKSKNATIELEKAKNRISSISDLYNNLYLKNDSTKYDTLTYFQNITKNINEHFPKNIKILYDIKHNISIHSVAYCGLILNELITNSFKYAFKGKESGNINIQVYKKDDEIYMIVTDDGIGFKGDTENSLGLTIVETLVQTQLNGEIEINHKNGTQINIKWISDE